MMRLLWSLVLTMGAGWSSAPSVIFQSNRAAVVAVDGMGESGTGVILPEGYLLTVDTVVGVEGVVTMRKDDVTHRMRPFWRSPRANLALLYAESLEGATGRDQPLRPDYFIGSRNTLALPTLGHRLPAGEILTAIGLPVAHREARRMSGGVLPDPIHSNTDLGWKIDMPVPAGWLGSPLFDSAGRWVGLLSGPDVMDEHEETPVARAADLEMIRTMGLRVLAEPISNLVALKAAMPVLQVKPGSERKLAWDHFDEENCGVVEGDFPYVSYEGNAGGGRWAYKDRGVPAYHFTADWFGESGETATRKGSLAFEMILRGDGKAGVCLVLDTERGQAVVEARKGGARKTFPMAFPAQVLPGHRIRLEVVCQGERIGISYHGMPLVVVEKCGFTKGGPDIRFTGRGPQTLENILLTIPR